MEVDEAYTRCLRAAGEHYENFPVASLLLPRRMRPHVAAVYAFARAADDFADEGTASPAERLILLQSWRARLHEAAAGPSSSRPLLPGEPAHTPAIFLAVGTSIRRLDLSVDLFDDLLSAFEQDIRVVRYESWSELLDYCRRSANPVGRLVLRIADAADERRDVLSDAICTALQLTNFWQDVALDCARGRVYVPRQIQRVHGAQEETLGAGLSAEWRAALADVVARTRELFEFGRPLTASLSGRLRFEVRATWLGGMRILDRIERAGFDVLTHRPTLGGRDAAWITMRLLQ